MTKPAAHKWAFAARFRRHVFGWRSQPAIRRVKEAVAEIQKVARKDPVLAATGAVVFLEKVSPALEQVDSSSGAIGTAVNQAVEALARIISAAPADDKTRDQWLDRLWEAHQSDQIPYIECLSDYWGDLCGSPGRAEAWADQLIGAVEMSWGPNRKPGGYFHGTIACLSAMFRAERHEQLLALLEKAPVSMWHYREWGVKALAAMGRKADAIHYAEASRGLNNSPIAIARACEEILLSSGFADEAYARYAIEANHGTTFLGSYRAIAGKYPMKAPAQIIDDLVASTPGQEGKWFAAAKDAKLYDEAIALAKRTPCDPRTLARAARDFAATNPKFAIEAGVAALHWIAAGHGYEITSLDVLAAYSGTMEAAKHAAAAKLGFAKDLAAFAVKLEAAWEFRRWQDGRVLSVQPLGEVCEGLYSAHCYVAHRADLRSLFQHALPSELLHLDQRCIGVTQDEHGAEVTLANKDGRETRVRADVIVGADGIHSVIRKIVAPEVHARFSGLCAFRCLVPMARAPEVALRPVQTLWLGPGRHFVHYPISSGSLVNVVAFVPAGDWRTESWTADGRVEDLVSEFAGWASPVGELARSATETRRWAIYDRDPLERWTEGRVALIGDAAHAMLPFFAQGAAQAIEDAFVLAECLRGAAPGQAPMALQRYERIRRPRATQVQLMSRGRELKNHLPDGAAQEQRDQDLGAGNPLRESAWLYGYEIESDLEMDALARSDN